MMTQVRERTDGRVTERPVREPPVRKEPPPKAPQPPRVGLPLRWIGWGAVVVVVGAVALAAWVLLARSPGDTVFTAELFTQEREAGIGFTQPDATYSADLFTREREAGIGFTQPDATYSADLFTREREAGIGFTQPDATYSADLFTREREASVARPALPDEAMSGLTGPAARGEDVGARAPVDSLRWAGLSGPTLEEFEAGDTDAQQPGATYSADLFTQEREASVASQALPDEAMSELTGPAARGEDVGARAPVDSLRWAGLSGPTLEEFEAGGAD